MGGRQKSTPEEVLARFPLYYERYIEVFGGGGWVLFHKPPGTDFEVYNDLNGNLAALYRAVRDHPRELQERLRYVLNSREDFMRLKQVLEHPEGMEEVARARRLPGHPIQLRGRLRQLCGAAAQHVGELPTHR